MKWFVDSMLGYWISLLAVSLCCSAAIYYFYLADVMR